MLILVTDPTAVGHRAGPGHPESPARWSAVAAAAADPRIVERVRAVEPRVAARSQLLAVHHEPMLARLESLRGRAGNLDPDTGVSAESVDVALRAAGAGIVAVEELRAGRGDAAFCNLRPPGHHATANRSMGFCLINNLAVTAAALVASGERVLIADFDAHHGNGTQDIFWDEPSVLFISWHQSPLYPGTGLTDEIGGDAAAGRTVNLPLDPGATGDVYRSSLDELVGPIIDAFAPTWLLISAGFDGHELDPLTELGLRAGDFGDLTRTLMAAVEPGHTVAFLEGGYDLGALRNSAVATMAALLGERVHPEPPTSGGMGDLRRRRLFDVVAAAQGLR